ncbi:MAG: hypothetical protein U0797_11575 [Gemmataceae bacterium]
MATDAPPTPERRVSLWRRALIGVLVLAVASFVGLWVTAVGTRTAGRDVLGSVLAEIDRDDPRWRWEHLEEDRPPMANLDNSVRRAREAVQAEGRWEQKELQTAAGEELLVARPINLRLDAERLGVLRKAVAKRHQAVALALSLKDLPRGRATVNLTPDVIGTLLPDAQNPRQVTHLLELDSERLLHEGRGDGVADRVRASLHGGAGLRGEGFLISSLVRIAIRVKSAQMAERALGLGLLSDDSLRRMADHFAAERTENPLLDGMRGERAGYHVLFENLEAGRISLGDFLVAFEGRRGPVPEVVMRGAAVLYGPRLYEDHASMMRWMHRACKIAALSIHEQPAEWATYEKELRAFVADSRQSYRNLVTALLLPAVTKVAEAARRDNAILACIQAALAAERFRLANGRWPAKLDELRPTFLREVPADPYTGKPILLAATEDGVAVYSASKDGKDDGGRVLTADGKPGSDYGVRLYNPDRRGLEPLGMPTPDFEPLKMPRVEEAGDGI